MVRSASGKKCENFKTIFFLFIPVLSSFVLGFQIYHLFGRVILKNRVKKRFDGFRWNFAWGCPKWRHYPNLFYGPLHSKNKDIGLKLCTPVVVSWFYNMYLFSFWYLENFWFNFHLFFKEKNNFGGQKHFWKIWDKHFLEHVIWHLLPFVVCVLL